MSNIIEAIEEKRLLTFSYKGSLRSVEPHTLGVDTKGHETLCAWQLSGGSGVGFRDFHAAEMSNVQVSELEFSGPRQGYKRGDSSMSRIYAQL